MSARAIASGTVSFGLVSIPVKLYSATQQAAGISFNLLHKKCGSRLKQQYTCPVDQEKVEREDMVKGYEFAKDQYVTFTAEELKAIEEKSTQAIEIAEFVPLDKIDPIYFDKPYYLGPDKGGEKAYALLGEVMRRTGRSALAKYAARGKQYLVLIRPVGEPGGAQKHGLVMQQLLYADEVRALADVPLNPVEVKEQEVKLALQLVDQISSDAFRPEQYEDEVRKRLSELVQKKVEGQEVSFAQPEPGHGQIIDLMEALKASLEKGEKKAPAAAAAEGGAEELPRKAPRRAPGRAAAEPRAKSHKK
jgi:DNA end-binding protein Ku